MRELFGTFYAKWAFVLLAGFAGIALALCIGQVALVRSADTRLSNYAAALFGHAINVAEVSRNVMATLNASQQTACSPGDLLDMRRLSFEAEFLRDVGRIEDGAIVCTALWGRLAEPYRLPPPQRVQHGGDMLWANVPEVGSLRRAVDMAGRDHAIVFTSPLAFKTFEQRHDAFGALVLTRDARHIYRAFGPVNGLGKPADHPTSKPWGIGRRRIWSQCANGIDICVVAALDNVSLFHLPPWIWAGIALLGALGGGGIGLAAYLHRNAALPLPERVRRAIASGGLSVVYQPLVRMNDRTLIGVEALARLGNDPYHETIPPDVFIQVAEEHGMIGEISRRMIHTALADMRSRLLAEREFHCGVNLSIADLLDPDFLDFLDREVTGNGVDPSRIVLEVTERSTADHERLIACMTAFRDRGYQFYIDDFGTGYSSLAYLAKLPINGIKIDRMFTEAIGREAVSSAIVENVFAIARILDVHVVVEGVETRAQEDYIRQIGPKAVGQGWLYGKPLLAREILGLPG